MPAKISSELRAAVLAHHQNGLSSRKIVEKVKEAGYRISKSSVNRTIKEKYWEDEGEAKPAKRLGTQNQPSMRTKQLIEDVKYLIDRPNPFSQRQISQKLDVPKKNYL